MSVHFYTHLIRIERKDGTVHTMTELDKDITYNSEVYLAAAGFTATVIDSTANLSVNNAQWQGPINILGLSRIDLVAGLFDGALVDIFLWDWENNVLVKHLGAGDLGEIAISGNSYDIEFRSQTQKAQQTIGRIFQRDCDASVGDTRCGVNLTPYTYTGSITSVTSNSVLIDSALISTQSDDYYAYGNLMFTSGLNADIAREVKIYTDATGTFTTILPFPFAISPGDTFTVYAGCNRTKTMCRTKFDNVINFRGFDMKPSRTELLKVGGQ